MTNIEKIRQEVERLMKETEDSQFDKGERYGLKAVLAFIDSLLEEKPSEDMEKAAEKYSDKYCSDWAYRLEYEDAFIAGAEWQKEQMMKDTVEGVVMNFSSNTPRPQIDVFVDPHKYCSKDKVKIVIIKDND